MQEHRYIGKTKEEAIQNAIEDLQELEENLIIKEVGEEKGGLFKSKKVEIKVIERREVSKYIKEQNSFKTYSTYSGPTPEENPPEKELIVGFSFLSHAELDSYNDFLKEFGL